MLNPSDRYPPETPPPLASPEPMPPPPPPLPPVTLTQHKMNVAGTTGLDERGEDRPWEPDGNELEETSANSEQERAHHLASSRRRRRS